MNTLRVLIVEDDTFIAMSLEDVLADAGYEICGVAGSESEALAMGAATRPSFAVVDMRLSPGDGRVVARELVRLYDTAVLMATSHGAEFESLSATGAMACLPKPYAMWDVPAALQAISDLRDGRPVGRLPTHMFNLSHFARRREDPLALGLSGQARGWERPRRHAPAARATSPR
jgi:DNA-binding response OmpR family regulator